MSECVYILLPVHNRCGITRKFIESLIQQTYDNYHLLLIDDGSTDGTDEMVQALISEDKLTIIKGSGDWWWAGSLQQGLHWLKKSTAKPSDIVLMINDDVVFKSDFLKSGVGFVRDNRKILLLAQSYDEKKGEVIESGVKADLRIMEFKIAEYPEEINCLSTRGLFVRWDVMQNIGGFYPVLLPHYWSDYEFTLRAKRKGFRLETCPEVYLTPSVGNTGTHSLDINKYASFLTLLKVTFSKRSIPNPIYRTSFILLTVPLPYVPVNILKTWVNTMLTFIKMARKSLKNFFEGRRVKKEVKGNIGGVRIIIGAGPTEQKGWISTDYPVVDVTSKESMGSFFHPNGVSAMLSEHVWEHLDEDLALNAVENCFEYLKPGGYIRLAVPDGYHIDAEYIEEVKPGGTGAGSDDHKVLYNCDSLVALFEKVGFQVKLLEWFDNEGNFHAEDWSEEDGLIMRSTRFDGRNKSNPTAYTSLIIDAVKPK